MALSLTCSCGAQFEVADTFAGQTITCPDCQQSVKVPTLQKGAVRTSGYALASTVLSLIGAFTIVLTVVAVVLGLIALRSIARHRRQVTGAGYAVFGIVTGLAFTGLTVVALSRGELIGMDRLREQLRAGQVDYTGPMEIVRAQDGFAISRPSPRWGVSRGQLAEHLLEEGDLLLANLAKDAYVEVNVTEGLRHLSLEQCRDDFLSAFHNPNHQGIFQRQRTSLRMTGFKLRESRRLPPVDGTEGAEMLFEVRLAGQALTYLAHIIKKERSDRVYVVSGWVARRHFGQLEPELRRALESFRLVSKN